MLRTPATRTFMIFATGGLAALIGLVGVVGLWAVVGDPPFVDLESDRPTGSVLAVQDPGFEVSELRGEISDHPTSLQFGPDGRLYVAQDDGTINVYTVRRGAENDYRVEANETIDLIKDIANHDDDGSLNGAIDERLVTGILVTGNAPGPVIYVTSSDPRIGGGGGADLGTDTNSGVLSRLNWDGHEWRKLDLVRGLPRSRHNHATNGMQLDPVPKILYVAQGGNTNQGAPSEYFGQLPEYALSAAILKVDLAAIGDSTYDLPTLDDPSRPDSVDGDEGDPFGGNGGANQAILVDDGPVQIHSPGWRNPYDLVLTTQGRLYATDNGSSVGWGGRPDGDGSAGNCSNEPSEPGERSNDSIHLIEGAPYYAGHPNPTRANRDNTFNGQSPVSEGDPLQCDFRERIPRNNLLAVVPMSTDGITEYLGTNFGRAMTGDLLAVTFNGELQRMQLNDRGNAILKRQILATGFAENTLDVTVQGDSGDMPGTIWVAAYGDGKISVFEPADFDEHLAHVSGQHVSPESPADEQLPPGDCLPGEEQGLGQWKVMSPSATARQEHSFQEVGGHIYMVAGAGGDFVIESYDPAEDAWTTLDARFPYALHHIQAVTLDGLIYFIGGLVRWPDIEVGSVLIFDPAEGTFRRGADMPPGRSRGAGGVAVHEGKIYYAGGLHGGRVVSWVDVYDPTGDSWDQLVDMPAARDHFNAHVVDGVLYAIGGRDLEVSDTLATDYAYDLNASDPQWAPLGEALPTPRAGYASVVLGDEILIIGGETEATNWNNVEAYNTQSGEWRALAPLPTARHGVSAAVLDGVAYVSGGAIYQDGPSTTTTQLEAFHIDGAPDCN